MPIWRTVVGALVGCRQKGGWCAVPVALILANYRGSPVEGPEHCTVYDLRTK